jgi:hypothetical protein
MFRIATSFSYLKYCFWVQKFKLGFFFFKDMRFLRASAKKLWCPSYQLPDTSNFQQGTQHTFLNRNILAFKQRKLSHHVIRHTVLAVCHYNEIAETKGEGLFWPMVLEVSVCDL